MLIAIGAALLAAAAWFRPRRGVQALLAGLAAMWLVWSLWAYPLLNDSSSAAGVMRRARQMAGANDEIGLVAWREAIKAAMFLTTDNATAQVKLLLGPERCVRIEPTGDDAAVEMDDYDAAFARLPAQAAADFAAHKEAVAPFFAQAAAPRERHYTTLPRED